MAQPQESRRRDLASLAIFAFAAVVLLLKQTVPLGIIGVPLAPRLPLVAAGVVLFELAPAVAAPARGMVLRILAVDALVSLMTEADLVYFRINRRFLSVLTLPLVPYVTKLGGAIASAIRPGDALLLVDLAVLLAIALALPSIKATERRAEGKVLAGVGLATLLVVSGTDPYWRNATLRNPASAGHASLLPFHVMGTGNALWTALRARYSRNEELSELQRWYDARRPRQIAAASRSESRRPRYQNVIVVQFESLQAWVLGMRLGGKEVTPRLNALRERAVSFENAYSQVGAGNTADAEWLSLCSFYPASAGVAFIRYASAELSCLPSLLRRSGFETIAFHGNDLSVYNRDDMYVTAGFARRYGREELHADAARYEIPDRALYAQILPLIPRDRPFALHVVSFSSHRPFAVPRQPLPLGDLAGTVAGDYLNSVHYADAAFGEFVDALEADHLLSRTVLVVYGDHAGINREDKGTNLLPLALPANEAAWLVFERRVPLLFYGQGLGPARVDLPAGQIDIAPTIAGLFDVSTGHSGFLGRDLLRTDPRPIVFWSGSVLGADRVYVEGRANVPLCFSTAGAQVETKQCDALAALGRRERGEAQIALDADLVTSLER